MSSISEFIRRNRGKIIAGSVIAGGAYFAQKYLRRYYDEQQQLRMDQNLAAAATTAFGMDPQRMMLQNRRYYIFDSNQRTCDNSILQLVPSIKTKLQKRLDVESLADCLKKQTDPNSGHQQGYNEESSSVNKFETWDQMKIEAFSRLLSASISYSILVVSLKTQISILAAQIYENSAEPIPTRFESWFSKLWSAMGGQMHSVKPRTGEAKRPFDVASLKSTSSIQQLFLQALQFFINKGVDMLNDLIQPVVIEHLGNYSLKDPLTFDQLTKLIQSLRSKIVSTNTSGRHFSFYVVPLCSPGSLPDEPQLEELLIILKTVLESPEAQDIFDFGMDNFIDGALKFITKTVPGFGQQRGAGETEASTSSSTMGIPLARLIPPLTDAFHDISRVNFDSALSNFIISQELHEFCLKVFNRDQHIW